MKRYCSIMGFLTIVLLIASCNRDVELEEGIYLYEGEMLFSIIPNAVTDVDGNTYTAVRIGNQIWMRENVRTTKYADGTSIAHESTSSYNVAYWCYPNNNSSNKTIYGLLYNWKAVMRTSMGSESNPSGVQGICPDGWHVPSKAEFEELLTYCEEHYAVGRDKRHIAKALASMAGWRSSSYAYTPGNNPSANNISGFSAVPAGYYYGSYLDFGRNAGLWSSTPNGSAYAYKLDLCYVDRNADLNNGKQDNGFSVRCVSDGEIGGGGTPVDPIPSATFPSVTTSTVSNITYTSATCGGNVTADGGATVTARGVCWSTMPNPTIGNRKTIDGTGLGSFTSTITDLVEGTKYYVRAYATNSVGTAYGEEISFFTTTKTFICGTSTVKDIDNNTYNTVQIGDQCWMKENLRTTKYADGTSISQGFGTSTTIADWYYPNNSSSNKETYGLLYNWKAVMRNASSSSANPSGVQGICPNGWHVPSDAEWTQLINYVKNQSQYQCNGISTNIAKALASPTGWASSSDLCAVGNNQSSNNATGFSAFPAGLYAGDFSDFGGGAYFWSATPDGSDGAYGLSLLYGYKIAYLGGYYRIYGFSVRCLSDK